MHIRGITKIRNEAHIINLTLDRWAEYCDAIHVYDDCSDDGTVEICRQHPAVVEVISSDLFDPDRLRSEWYNRQVVLRSAQRFNPDWIAYFDGDEWLYHFDKSLLSDPFLKIAGAHWFDVYITPEDAGKDWRHRRWGDPSCRQIPLFYRNSPYLRFATPDQRIMYHEPAETLPLSGIVKHWGKGWSEALWKRKVEYYGHVFGRYGAKWRARKGKAVHHDYKSDTGLPLVTWDEAVRRCSTIAA